MNSSTALRNRTSTYTVHVYLHFRNVPLPFTLKTTLQNHVKFNEKYPRISLTFGNSSISCQENSTISWKYDKIMSKSRDYVQLCTWRIERDLFFPIVNESQKWVKKELISCQENSMISWKYDEIMSKSRDCAQLCTWRIERETCSSLASIK